MKSHSLAALALATLVSSSQSVGAQQTNTPAPQPAQSQPAQQPQPNQTQSNQRQEARQEARETRQAGRQAAGQTVRPGAADNERSEARQARREQRQQAVQRLNNRSSYYGTETWNQLDAWIARNDVSPLERVAQIAEAAVDATERAINSASKAADNATDNATYGFMNTNGPGEEGWFYDYYSYRPTYYNAPATGTSVYGSATRYYDLDNDGVYESLNVFRDSDNNASYDVYDRYDFTEEDKAALAAKADPNPVEMNDAPEDARRHSITGQIYASKIATVNGVENLIVRLSNVEAGDQTGNAQARNVVPSVSPDETTIVDLGAMKNWKARDFKAGDRVTAIGPIERIGDRQILIADTVSLNEQKAISVARSAPRNRGMVVDVTQADVKGTSHTLAIVEFDSKRQLVDLGPAEKLKVKVEPKTEITVQGVPVRAGKHSVIQAERVAINGQDIAIQRW
ncbi:MAG: hypothetical protein IT423_13140 [Pirellulaceae bacterium]|nr:hypothetical protein [Pirellulaceae bacterium]